MGLLFKSNDSLNMIIDRVVDALETKKKLHNILENKKKCDKTFVFRSLVLDTI